METQIMPSELAEIYAKVFVEQAIKVHGQNHKQEAESSINS